MDISKRSSSEPDAAELHRLAEAYKKQLTPEELKWYENPQDLVPLSQVIAELEGWVRRENLHGTDE